MPRWRSSTGGGLRSSARELAADGTLEVLSDSIREDKALNKILEGATVTEVAPEDLQEGEVEGEEKPKAKKAAKKKTAKKAGRPRRTTPRTTRPRRTTSNRVSR